MRFGSVLTNLPETQELVAVLVAAFGTDRKLLSTKACSSSASVSLK